MRTTVVVVVGVAASLLLAGGAAADRLYGDPAGDPTDGAPDITEVAVAEDGAGAISFTTTVAPLPSPDTLVLLWLGDQDASTGMQGFDWLFVLDGSDLQPLEFRWDGAEFVNWASASVSQTYADGVWRLTVDVGELGWPTSLDFFLGAVKLSGEDVVGRDVAPSPDGVYTYEVTSQPPPPPPPPPAPLRLTVGKATLRAPAHAGWRLTVAMPVMRSDGRRAVGRTTCTAHAGSRRTQGTGRVIGGKAQCTLRVPARTRGLRLRGSMTAKVGTARITKAFSIRIH